MALEFLGQKLDLIDMNDYPIELPTKALLIVLLVATAGIGAVV